MGEKNIESGSIENTSKLSVERKQIEEEMRIELGDELRKEMRDVGIYEAGANIYLRPEAIDFLNRNDFSGLIERKGAGKGADQLIITNMHSLRELTEDEIKLLPQVQNDAIWYHGTCYRGDITPGSPRKIDDPSLGGLYLSNNRVDAEFYAGDEGLVRVFEYTGDKTLEIKPGKGSFLLSRTTPTSSKNSTE